MLNIKNKFNCLFKLFFLTNSNLFFIFNNYKFLKNEFYLYINCKFYIYSLFNYCKPILLDLVGFDTNFIKYSPISNYKCGVYIIKLFIPCYNIYINLLVNFITNSLVYFKNSTWLYREFIEFFGIHIIGLKDCRNLLNDYTNLNFFLLKNIPVSSFLELKTIFNKSVYFYKNIISL